MHIRVQGVHHVKVTVTDLARIRSWYESVLPLTAHLDFPDEGGTVRGVVYDPLGSLTLPFARMPPPRRCLGSIRSPCSSRPGRTWTR